MRLEFLILLSKFLLELPFHSKNISHAFGCLLSMNLMIGVRLMIIPSLIRPMINLVALNFLNRHEWILFLRPTGIYNKIMPEPLFQLLSSRLIGKRIFTSRLIGKRIFTDVLSLRLDLSLLYRLVLLLYGRYSMI